MEVHVLKGKLAHAELWQRLVLVQSKLSHSEEGPCAILHHTAATFDKDCPPQLHGIIRQCFKALRNPCDKVVVTPCFKQVTYLNESPTLACEFLAEAVNVLHRCYDLIYENNFKDPA